MMPVAAMMARVSSSDAPSQATDAASQNEARGSGLYRVNSVAVGPSAFRGFCCKSPGGASAASALRRRCKYDSSRCRCEEFRFFELSRLGLGFYPWTLR